MFPFLIGKVLTRGRTLVADKINTVFPFLIGKVLTVMSHFGAIWLIGSYVSIPYR